MRAGAIGVEIFTDYFDARRNNRRVSACIGNVGITTTSLETKPCENVVSNTWFEELRF